LTDIPIPGKKNGCSLFWTTTSGGTFVFAKLFLIQLILFILLFLFLLEFEAEEAEVDFVLVLSFGVALSGGSGGEASWKS